MPLAQIAHNSCGPLSHSFKRLLLSLLSSFEMARPGTTVGRRGQYIYNNDCPSLKIRHPYDGPACFIWKSSQARLL